ncbi:7214_t:CDS:2 [Scutellospora calospora]|uniref:7214_t:CDS:1 n=1 Tax=Scutellospora calospora TaxID=85575 RepID=A0ACA9L0L5_9GLOM|nr:7214_t:CDS:2 [Scutellospora calospora]
MGKVHSKPSKPRHQKSKSLPKPEIKDQDVQKYMTRRKYSASYVLPVDDDEIDRMTLQHYIFQNIWKNNFSSPVESLLERGGAKVLDIGCGPGVFVLELASKYPKSQFTGCDIVANYPIQIKPENSTFVRANVVERLPFDDNTFDFVYMRFMMFALMTKEWPYAISEMVRVTKPGGWIEVMERDILWFNEGEVIRNWRTKIVDGLKAANGIDLIISPHLPNYLAANKSLSKISKDERIEPLGAWGGILGKSYAQIIMWGAKNLSEVVNNIKFQEGDYEKLVEIAMDELDKNHAFDKSYRFWAMKTSR